MSDYKWIYELGLKSNIAERDVKEIEQIMGDTEAKELLGNVVAVLFTHMGILPDDIRKIATDDDYARALIGLHVFLHDYLQKRGA